MGNQTVGFVGSIPENYDRYLGPVLFSRWAEDVARIVGSSQPKSVLELAAGTGIVTRELRDKLSADCGLVATDLSTQMLEIAQTKFQQNETVRFEQADATDLQYADASFDFVICQFGVTFFADKKRSYTEALRVLKSGGTYLFTLWDSMEANPFARLVHETIVQHFPSDPPSFFKVPYGYTNADEIKDLVISAGFSRVVIERPVMNSKIVSAHDFAKGLVLGSPLYEEVVARGGKQTEVCEALEETIRKNIGSELPLKILRIRAEKS